MWRRHHRRWRAAKPGTMPGTRGPRAGRDTHSASGPRTPPEWPPKPLKIFLLSWWENRTLNGPRSVEWCVGSKEIQKNYLTFILVKSFNLLMPAGRNDFSLCIQNFSLLFLSASVQWMSWSITTTVMSSHECPSRLKCSATGSWTLLVFMVDRWLLILRRISPVSPTYCFWQILQLIK